MNQLPKINGTSEYELKGPILGFIRSSTGIHWLFRKIIAASETNLQPAKVDDVKGASDTASSFFANVLKKY